MQISGPALRGSKSGVSSGGLRTTLSGFKASALKSVSAGLGMMVIPSFPTY